MEVVAQNLGASSRRLDGGGVDLEEFLQVDGAVVLLGLVRKELVGPIHLPQVRRERSTAGSVWPNAILGGGVIARRQA